MSHLATTESLFILMEKLFFFFLFLILQARLKKGREFKLRMERDQNENLINQNNLPFALTKTLIRLCLMSSEFRRDIFFHV